MAVLTLNIESPDAEPFRIRELTVRDVRQILESGGDVGMREVLAVCPGVIEWHDTAEPDAHDLSIAWMEFCRLNRAVFSQPTNIPKTQKDTRSVRKAATEMDRACLMLIERGHSGVWEYPFRLYVMLAESFGG